MNRPKDRRAEVQRYADAHNGEHPDWCECERCIQELMSNHQSSNRKGGDFLRTVIEYDGTND